MAVVVKLRTKRLPAEKLVPAWRHCQYSALFWYLTAKIHINGVNIFTHSGHFSPYDQTVVVYTPKAETLRETVIRDNPALEFGFGVVDPTSRLVLLPHHFDCNKTTVEKRHGKGDERLNANGYLQATTTATCVGKIALAQSLWTRNKGRLLIQIYSSEDERCRNSAAALAALLGERVVDSTVRVAPTQLLPELNRIGPGDLDGLTDEQIARADPVFAGATQRWMAGESHRPPVLDKNHGGEDPAQFWLRMYGAAQIMIDKCEGITIPFASFSARTAIKARLSLRGAEDIASDGLPYEIPFQRERRDTFNMFSISDLDYVQPIEGLPFPLND